MDKSLNPENLILVFGSNRGNPTKMCFSKQKSNEKGTVMTPIAGHQNQQWVGFCKNSKKRPKKTTKIVTSENQIKKPNKKVNVLVMRAEARKSLRFSFSENQSGRFGPP